LGKPKETFWFFLAYPTWISHCLGWTIETQGDLTAISARFRHNSATFRQEIGLFDPRFDTILAPGDPILAGFSVLNRRLVGAK
jgi:hypothetical protein